ncbi:hypothetical protein KG091_04935 [Carnobacteriaceae bacterium zg-ZUI78]|nr:hypothetical protein [Carnobacteriaceae bacterium zg-ZUI78]
MNIKNKENILLGGMVLGLVGIVVNCIRIRKVDEKVNYLGEHVDTNFTEFSSKYNTCVDLQDERYQDTTNDMEEVKNEVIVCYDHIETLSKQLDKSDKKQVEV